MALAQRGQTAAPFALARGEGFVFRSRSLQMAFDAFQKAEASLQPSVLILGPAGIGKTSILDTYVEERAEMGVLSISLDADVLEEGHVAELILAGFGQAPAPGASARLALHDFIQDVADGGERPIVAVDQLDATTPAALLELASLARAPEEGGTGFVLLAGAENPVVAETLRVPTLPLEAFTPDEVQALLAEILRGGGLRLSITDAAVDALLGETQGLIGQIAPRLDQASARCLDDQADSIDAHHVTGEAAPTPGPTPPGPSPEDIEAALLAIGGADEPAREIPDTGVDAADDEAQQAGSSNTPAAERSYKPALDDHDVDQAFDALRHEKARSYLPKDDVGLTDTAPTPGAPEPRPSVSPRVVDALEELALTLEHLRQSLDFVREESGRLQTAAHQRKEALRDAAGSFVTSLQIRQRNSSEE